MEIPSTLTLIGHMPELSDQEALTTFETIRDTLRSMGLDWVVQQVESTIALGKPRRRRLQKEDVREQVWPIVSPKDATKSRGRPAEFIVAEEYLPRERLVLLADAIRAAVVQPAQFAASVLSSIPEQMATSGVAFRPELESSEGFVVSPAEVLARSEAVQRLSSLLDELTGIEPNAAPAVTTR